MNISSTDSHVRDAKVLNRQPVSRHGVSLHLGTHLSHRIILIDLMVVCSTCGVMITSNKVRQGPFTQVSCTALAVSLVNDHFWWVTYVIKRLRDSHMIKMTPQIAMLESSPYAARRFIVSWYRSSYSSLLTMSCGSLRRI